MIYAINADAWDEWTEYRRKILRKPVSEFARERQWKMLEKYPPGVQRQIIDHSMDNEYQGLFPPKGKISNSTRDISLKDSLEDRSWAQ